MRKDISNTLSVKSMADEFYLGDTPFPSRGVYGDGIAYASPSWGIAEFYATADKSQKGGAIIEFKLKQDARVILYEDALDLFRKLMKRTDSKLLFNYHQDSAKGQEVGKAMNALEYDAILKHDGDHTGQDFYVILNRGALEAKEKYIAART